MRSTPAKLAPRAAVLAFCALMPLALRAQSPGATLSGTITGPTGNGVSNATVSAINLTTNQVSETHTALSGAYSFPNLPPGDYDVSVSAEGFSARTSRVTLPSGARQTLDIAVSTSVNLTEPSLEDLGFSPSQTQGNARLQALLDRRSRMLKMHQRLGLITTGPLVATIITSLNAKGHHGTPGSPSGRNLHAALGAATAGLYFTTAYFAIRAPKISGTETRGPIRVHKALAWVHGTGMILTPILGAIAYSQLSRGERVHGIAKAHGPVAVITGAAYGAAIISVSFKF